jgi:WD40 repeat protein
MQIVLMLFANYILANDNFSGLTSHKIVYGHEKEIVAWSFFTKDHHVTEHSHERTKEHSHKPFLTGLVATADTNGTILIRDLNTGVVFHNINVPIDSVEGFIVILNVEKIIFSPDHKQLAVCVRPDCELNTSILLPLVIFFDVQTGRQATQPITASGDVVEVMNYSVDGKQMELFVKEYESTDSAITTTRKLYDISGNKPELIIGKSATGKFVTPKKQVKYGQRESQLYEDLAHIFEANAIYATPYPLHNYEIICQQRIRQPNWVEQKLVGARNVISKDHLKVATIYPSGNLHVWSAITGQTIATCNMGLRYYLGSSCYYDSFLNHGDIDSVQSIEFSYDNKNIIIFTRKSVNLYNIKKNCIIATYKPELSQARPTLHLSLNRSVTDVRHIGLYKEIFLCETEKNFFACKIEKMNKLLLNITKDNRSLAYSETGRYVVLQDKKFDDDRYKIEITNNSKLWDNETCKMSYLFTNKHEDKYELCFFSLDDKYMLLKREDDKQPALPILETDKDVIDLYQTDFETASRSRLYYRYDISNHKIIPMNDLNKIEPVQIRRQVDGYSMMGHKSQEITYMQCFDVPGELYPVRNDKHTFVRHGNEDIIISSADFEFICRKQIDDDDEQYLPFWKHAVAINDADGKLKQVTLRFDIDDYLIIKADGTIGGSDKGQKRYITDVKMN